MKTESTQVTTYRGVAVMVSLSASPKFWAVVNGVHARAGSFGILVKKLDEMVNFSPFEALHIRGREIETVEIIGLEKDSYGFHYLHMAAHSNGGEKYPRKFSGTLYPVAMREELETYLANAEQWDKEKEAIEAARAASYQAAYDKRIRNPGDEQ